VIIREICGKNKITSILLYCSLFTLHYSLLNSQTYSLQDCIRLATENNIDIKIQRLNVQSTHLQHRQTKNNLLPSLNLSTGTNYNIGYSISPLDYSYSSKNSFSGNLNISSQVTLFSGFQQLRAIEKAEIDKNAVVYQIQSIENNVKIQVINLYLQTIMEYETLKVLTNQVEISKSLLRKKREAAESGLIAKNSYREQQLQITIDEANQSRQEFQVENALNRLKVFLQIPVNQNIKIDRTLDEIQISNQDNLNYIDYKSFQSLPDVQLENLRLQSLNKQIEIYKGALYPTVTLGYALGSNFINTAKTYDYKTINYPIIGFVSDSQQTRVRSLSSQNVAIAENDIPVFTQLSNNKQHQFQLNLQWQIFGKGAKRTNIKLADLASKQQEYRIKLTEQKMKDNYFQALSNVQAAFKKYETSVVVFNAQKERYNLSKEKFENNRIDYFEFVNYQNQVQNSELELSKSKLEWYFNREILKLYGY
jgi:outer membrane protein